MDKKRMYLFNGQSVLLDNYEYPNQKRFDQNFDTMRVSQSQNMNPPIQSQSNNTSYRNLDQFMMSGEYEKENRKTNEEDHKSEKKMQTFRAKLIPEKEINDIKDHFYKVRGYVENKPDVLFIFFQEFRSYVKRSLKLPEKIKHLIKYTDDDMYYSLKFYYDIMISSQNQKQDIKSSTIFLSKAKSSNAYKSTGIVNKFQPRFSNDTLKRLYPAKKGELEENKPLNSENIGKFVEKLVAFYKIEKKEYTNDENKLYDFWLSLARDRKEEKDLVWEIGEKNLEGALRLFFSDDKIIERLSAIFKNVCGYDCYHPRPLHDYWEDLIPIDEKFLKGINKHDAETLYKILQAKYYQRVEDENEKEEKEREIKKRNEELEKNNKKVTREQYKILKKKFAKLAKPKDKWRTGRVMRGLRKQFKYDNIINKMIKYEFSDNKVLRLPEEYAIYDSDQERKVIFKNSLEKTIKQKEMENEEKIKELMHKTKYEDDAKKRKEDEKFKKKLQQDYELDKFIKKMVIRYFFQMQDRINSGKVIQINNFLNEIYQIMLKKYREATRRRFKKVSYDLQKIIKKKRMHAYYPIVLKNYFFHLIRRIGIKPNGQYYFAKHDNLSFWAPSLSNHCKVHGNNCPLYCIHNSHNNFILTQKTKNFNNLFSTESKLCDDERLNLWKRQDLAEEKKKIFLCLNEAEHCTFEPKILKKEDEIRALSNDEIIGKRISNKVWVNQMGTNFSNRFPLVYKEGICKKAKNLFQEGKYTATIELLKKAFDLDEIKAFFEPKFAEILKKRKLEENQKNIVPNVSSSQDNQGMIHQFQSDKKKLVEKDNFGNEKNKQICTEVYEMMKEIEEYKKEKIRYAQKLKEEIKMIEDTHKDIQNTYKASLVPSFFQTEPLKMSTTDQKKLTQNEERLVDPLKPPKMNIMVDSEMIKKLSIETTRKEGGGMLDSTNYMGREPFFSQSQVNNKQKEAIFESNQFTNNIPSNRQGPRLDSVRMPKKEPVVIESPNINQKQNLSQTQQMVDSSLFAKMTAESKKKEGILNDPKVVELRESIPNKGQKKTCMVESGYLDKTNVNYQEYQKKDEMINSKFYETNYIGGSTNLKSQCAVNNQKSTFIKDRYFKFFKTMMCPLKDQCPYDLRPRWPHSDIKASIPFGVGCPYAHQLSELKFEQEVKEKIKLRLNLLKQLENDEDPYIAQEWVPTGPIISCIGCGKTFSDKSAAKGKGAKAGAGGGPKGLCGFCRYRQKNEMELKKDKAAADKANKKILKKIDYQGKPEEWDQDYVKKFGILKRAAVLYSFRRYTEAYAIMEELNKLIHSENDGVKEKFNSLDHKWRAKLEIKEEIPEEIFNCEITPETIEMLKIKTPLSTLLVYVEKMKKWSSFSIYNRHTYLNIQIAQFFKTVKRMINSYGTDVKHISKQIKDLDTWITKKEKLHYENKELYHKYSSRYRAKMCPNIQKYGKCMESSETCIFAHTPNQLNLIPPEDTKMLMTNTKEEIEKKKITSKTLVPWKYPRQKIYEQGPKYDKHLICPHPKGRVKRSKSEKRNKSLDMSKTKFRSHEI